MGMQAYIYRVLEKRISIDSVSMHTSVEYNTKIEN